MEKQIITWSYWLGIASAVMAIVARVLNVLGLGVLNLLTKGNPVGYHTFLVGAVLLFLIAIATASYSSSQSQSPAVAGGGNRPANHSQARGN